MNNEMFNSLNKAQIQAVKYAGGPSIILAGAGSGKTRVLVEKVKYLIQKCQVAPKSIVMITFTNKAAAEMKSRVHFSLGFIGTFHGLCASILRRKGYHLNIDPKFTIYDDNDQQALIKKIIKDIGEDRFTPGYYINRISAAKNQLIDSARYLKLFTDYNAAKVAGIYKTYERELKKNNCLDFDDLIMKVVQLFIKNSSVLNWYQNLYQYFLVDEFQDTNYAQYALIKLMAERDKNITVVGDFSQSIY